MEKHNFDVDTIISSSKQAVKINASYFTVGQTQIACDDVQAIRYGVSLVGTAKKPVRKIYSIEVQSTTGKTASIRFESQKATQLLEEDHTYAYIMSGLWQYAKKPLINKIIDGLNSQENLNLGSVKINFQGVEMSYKTWFWGKTKTVITPWSQLEHSLDKGIFTLQDNYNRSRKIKVSLHNDWNAVVLQTLVHYLWQGNRRQKLEKGETLKPAYEVHTKLVES